VQEEAAQARCESASRQIASRLAQQVFTADFQIASRFLLCVAAVLNAVQDDFADLVLLRRIFLDNANHWL
jgi:hypothetical protein